MTQPDNQLIHPAGCACAQCVSPTGYGPDLIEPPATVPSQAEVNPGWEARYQIVRNRVHISIDTKFLAQLGADGIITGPEVGRSRWKIALLEPFVTRMVVNMLKGSIKYTTDDWSAETWQDMGMDDKADGVNYELLFHEYLRKEGKI